MSRNQVNTDTRHGIWTNIRVEISHWKLKNVSLCNVAEWGESKRATRCEVLDAGFPGLEVRLKLSLSCGRICRSRRKASFGIDGEEEQMGELLATSEFSSPYLICFLDGLQVHSGLL